MSSRKLLKLLVIFLIISICFGLAAYYGFSKHSLSRRANNDNMVNRKEPITNYDVYFGSTHLRIPSNYLTLVGPWNENLAAYLNAAHVEVALPQFQPYELKNKAIFFDDKMGFQEIVRIFIAYNPSYRYKNNFEYLDEVVMRGGGRLELESNSSDASKLNAYRSSKPDISEYFYKKISPERLFFATCDIPAKTQPRIAFCEVSERLPGDVIVKYRFSRSHLEEWRAIDAKVFELINSFQKM